MWARDRRRRRRRLAPFIAGGVVVALFLGLLIDGLAHVGGSSAGYRRTITSSYALAFRPMAWSSNQTGGQLRSLMELMGAGQTCRGAQIGTAPANEVCRERLQQQLDALVNDSSQTASRVARMVPPAPPGGASDGFTAAFENRARAVAQLRSALDGLLGMSPLPVVGAPAQSAQSAQAAQTPTLLSANQAANQLIVAGGLLRSADRGYRQSVAQLMAQPGARRVPTSNWLGAGVVWRTSRLQAMVDQLEATPSLQRFHYLVILPQAINLIPPVIPPVSGSTPGVVVIPPTSFISVSVVVANQGNVAEPNETVSAQLGPSQGGSPLVVSQKLSIAAQASVTVAFRHLLVVPGTQYVLKLAVSIPPGQNLPAQTSYSITINVAPPTPLITTTTVPVTTTTQHPTATTRPATTTTRPGSSVTRPTSRTP